MPQVEVIPVVMRIDKIITFSGTPPYGRHVNAATSLLRPLFCGCLAKAAIHFLVTKAPVNTANFFWPNGGRVNGVPLLWNFILSTASL